MMLWDRRRALLHLGMAGLEMALVAILVVWIYPQAPSPVTVFGLLWGLQTGWMMLIDLGSAVDLDEPSYRWLIVTAVLVSTLFLVRFVLYPKMPIGQLDWLRQAWTQLFAFDRGFPAELVVVLLNLLVWQRALQAAGRSLHFLNLGRRVRLIWVVTAGAALASTKTAPAVTDSDLLWVVLLAFPIGMTVMVVGRIDDQAGTATTRGRTLSWGHLAQLVIVISLIFGLGLLPQLVPGGLPQRIAETVLGFVFLVTVQLLIAIVFLLYPVVLKGVGLVLRLAKRGDGAAPITPPAPLELPQDELASPLMRELFELPPSALTLLRVGALLVVVAGVIVMVTLATRALRRKRRRRREEGESRRRSVGGDALLRRGLQQLRNVIDMAQRVGLREGLLAAISVQNIYANLSRMASQRGYPRQQHQPPDQYLAALVEAFGGYEAALRRITDAYMRVHYGDCPLTRAHLRQVQSDYRQIRDSVT